MHAIILTMTMFSPLSWPVAASEILVAGDNTTTFLPVVQTRQGQRSQSPLEHMPMTAKLNLSVVKKIFYGCENTFFYL